MLKKIGRLGFFLGAFLLLIYLTAPLAVRYYASNVHGIDVGQVSLSYNKANFKKVYDATGRIRIEHIQIGFSLFSLINRQVKSLWVEGVQVEIKSGESGSNEIPKLGEVLDRIPFSIEDLKVADFAFQIPENEYVTKSIKIIGQLRGAILNQKQSHLSFSASTQGNDQMAGAQIEGSYKDGKAVLNIAIQSVRLKNMPMSVDIAAQIQQTNEILCEFKGSLSSTKQTDWLTWQGNLDRWDAGQLSFIVADWTIDSEQFPLALLEQKDLDLLESYSMILKGSGGLSWTPGHIAPHGLMEIHEGALKYQNIVIEGIKVMIPIEQLWPNINYTQNITVEKIQTPLMNLNDLRLGVHLKKDIAKLTQLSGKVWGGAVQMTGIQIMPLLKDQVMHLKLNNVSLQPLIDHLDLKNITADGTLNGDIPIHIYDDASISIQNGIIQSAKSGYIAYEWDTALASENENLKLAAKALQNFSYDQAIVTIEKQRHMEPELVLDIKGKNPRLLEGRRFEFKINLTGKILQALESMIQTFNADMKGLREQANKLEKSDTDDKK